METKMTIAKSIICKVFLVLPLFVFNFCQDHGEDVIDATKELMFTKYAKVSTLLKKAVEEDTNGDQCARYQYPIVFYAQVNSTNTLEVITVNSDEELINFFNELSSSDQIRIDFPIHLIDIDEETTEINTLAQLEDTLQVVVDACSGDVTYEYCHSNNQKVYICHNGNTICVSINAINAHLDHGDVFGQCN